MAAPHRSEPVPLTLLRRRPASAYFKEPLPCAVPDAPVSGLAPSRYNLRVLDGRAVYNTSTGNYVVLTSAEQHALDTALAGGTVRIADAPRLYETGLLLTPEIDEVESVRRAFGFATASRYAPHLTIAPTMDCNFGCDYCFESHVRGAMPEEVQDALAVFTGELLAHAGESPELSVTWFGGEPLMAMNVLDRLSERFRELTASGQAHSYTADIITNGHGLTPAVLDRLDRAGVRQVQVTIDGPRSVHDSRRYLKASGGGTFDRILENLRHTADRFRTVVRVNVDHTNADTVEELFLQLDEAGLLPRVLVDPSRVEAFSPDSTSADLFTAAEFASWRAELAAWTAARGWDLAPPPVSPSLTGVCQVDSVNSFVVDPAGRLFKCWAELGTPAPPVGTVTDRATWPTTSAGPLANRDPFDDPGCVACLLLPLCLGGCPKTREVGRAAGTTECPPHRHNITELVEDRYGTRTTIVNEVASADGAASTDGAASAPQSR